MKDSACSSVGMTEIVTRFRHHAPSDEQQQRMQQVRQGCLDLAVLIDNVVPHSREKSDALTNLEYVMYQANAGIARREE
jgi:hypothetical protein